MAESRNADFETCLGVVSGKASNSKVIGLATTHSTAQLRQAGADFIVEDLRSVEVIGHDAAGGVTIKICNSLAD